MCRKIFLLSKMANCRKEPKITTLSIPKSKSLAQKRFMKTSQSFILIGPTLWEELGNTQRDRQRDNCYDALPLYRKPTRFLEREHDYFWSFHLFYRMLDGWTKKNFGNTSHFLPQKKKSSNAVKQNKIF